MGRTESLPGLGELASGRFWAQKERSPPARDGRADPGGDSDQAEEFGAVAPEESLS
jgi:hypothetical protein